MMNEHLTSFYAAILATTVGIIALVSAVAFLIVAVA